MHGHHRSAGRNASCFCRFPSIVEDGPRGAQVETSGTRSAEIKVHSRDLCYIGFDHSLQPQSMLDASTEQAFSDDLVDPQAGWKVHISVPKYPPLFYGCDGVSLHPHMQESTLQRRKYSTYCSAVLPGVDS